MTKTETAALPVGPLLSVQEIRDAVAAVTVHGVEPITTSLLVILLLASKPEPAMVTRVPREPEGQIKI